KPCCGDERRARGKRAGQAGKEKIAHGNSLRRTADIVERLPRRAVAPGRVQRVKRREIIRRLPGPKLAHTIPPPRKTAWSSRCNDKARAQRAATFKGSCRRTPRAHRGCRVQ